MPARSISGLQAAHLAQQVKDVGFRGGLRRLGMLGGAGGGRGYGFEAGPEFARARALLEGLGGMEMPEDIGGVGDLTAAEQAALTEQQELIGGQVSAGEEELRNIIGRLGGGGSELQEAYERMRTGATGARVQALRGALTSGQQRVETRRAQALRGRETAAGGLTGLAGQRQAGEQFGAQMGLRAEEMRANLMRNLAPFAFGGGGVPALPGMGAAPSAFQTFTPRGPTGWSRMTEATEARNRFMWPTQYGAMRSGERFRTPARRL